MTYRIYITLIFIPVFILYAGLVTGCDSDSGTPGDKPEIIEQGSTVREDVIIDPSGDVLTLDQPGTEITDHNPDFPGLYPDAVPVHPVGEDRTQRESYITRDEYDQVVEHYKQLLMFGRIIEDVNSITEEEVNNAMVLQSLDSVDDGRRQITLWLNNGEEDRAGWKVALEEFPDQYITRIILTTMNATPMSLNPFGTWISPEELEAYSEETEQDDGIVPGDSTDEGSSDIPEDQPDENEESGDEGDPDTGDNVEVE